MSDCLGSFSYAFGEATIIPVSEWHDTSYRQGRQGGTLSRTVYLKLTPQYVKEFRDEGVSRELVEAVWVRYKVDGTNLGAT